MAVGSTNEFAEPRKMMSAAGRMRSAAENIIAASEWENAVGDVVVESL